MVTPNPTVEEENKVSVPGFTEEEIAHLSPGQRRKLAAERGAGQDASKTYAKAFEHNKRQVEQAQARQEAENGARKLLDPETITAQRVAEHRLSEQRARDVQAVNFQANAAKEAADQNETILGRGVIPANLAENITGAARDVAVERVEQAEQVGLTANQATHGHPENSPAQAEATMLNTQKELADRLQSGTAQQPMQGYGTEEVTVSRVPVFDNDGAFMGTQVGDVFEPDPDYDGGQQSPVPEVYEPNTDPNVGVRNTENQALGANPPPVIPQQNPESPADNGQPMQTSEPDAATLAAGLNTDDGDDAGSKKGRRKRPASTNTSSVGTGPVSE